MVSLIGMLVFPLPFLQSFAYAGSAVVALAALGAVVALPALLAVLGPGVNRLRVRRIHHLHTEGVWQRIANAVMRRPIPVALAAVAVLMVLGSPFLRIELGTSDERVLPASSPARAVGDILREEFATAESAALDVVAVGLADPAQIGSYAAALSCVPGVARVDAATGSYMAGMRVAEPGPASVRFLGTDATYLAVVPAVESTSAEAETLVEAIRATEAPVEVLVAGAAADLVDTKAAMFGGLWWAVGIIGAVTFVVLFLMFGSLLVPAKAVALNLLSLSATFGALVWIFQEGHLAGLLGFTPTGTLEITMPILLFAIAFGLSMDYEVFLLSRIKEEYDRTGDNDRSVAVGLERTGRIVTAAALLIAVVLVAFATSQVVFMKIFGVGMTIAVLVDAFVVRATLVPAFMRLAGRANWWAPAWLAAIHRRFGISEAVEPAEEEPSGVPL
jgi:RND superfamily putative drug exporter